TPRTASKDFAEHFVENIREARAEIEAAKSSGSALLESGMTETVIGGAALIVAQDLVSFRRFLEFVLGVLVALIAVGVMLHRQLAIGFFNVFRAGATGHAKDFVIIGFGGHILNAPDR